VAAGDNSRGECNVPDLPADMHFVGHRSFMSSSGAAKMISWSPGFHCSFTESSRSVVTAVLLVGVRRRIPQDILVNRVLPLALSPVLVPLTLRAVLPPMLSSLAATSMCNSSFGTAIVDQAAHEPVIQEVLHSEPASDIPPHEAAEIVQHQWAGSVELLTNAPMNAAAIDAVEVASSVLALPEAPECLLPCSYVLTSRGHPCSVTALSPGQELVPGRLGHAAIVHSVRTLSYCERNVVTLHFFEGAFTVTASHIVMVCLQQSQQRKSFRPMLASQVQPGDILRTLASQLNVTSVKPDVIKTCVVEVQLKDTRGSFFVGGSTAKPPAFVEVCGALAPLGETSVVIIRFQRYDRFRDIIINNEELAACRNQLEQAGFSVDLGSTELGPAKLLVRADLAWRVIMALRWRSSDQQENKLCLRDVVVSQELKAVLLEEVSRLAKRANPVVREETLELWPCLRARHTFAEFGVSSSSSSVTAHSSTDAHLGTGRNPRKRSRY